PPNPTGLSRGSLHWFRAETSPSADRLPQRRRSAFTLLEVILVLGISLLLLAGFCWSLTVMLDLAQSGRERVQQGVLARGILERISADITAQLAPVASGSQSAKKGSVGGAAISPDGTLVPPAPSSTSTDASPDFNVGIKGGSDY